MDRGMEGGREERKKGQRTEGRKEGKEGERKREK